MTPQPQQMYLISEDEIKLLQHVLGYDSQCLRWVLERKAPAPAAPEEHRDLINEFVQSARIEERNQTLDELIHWAYELKERTNRLPSANMIWAKVESLRPPSTRAQQHERGDQR